MSSRSKWEKLIASQAKSGLTQKRFCEERGINTGTFVYWKSRLKRESFIELPVVTDNSPPETKKHCAKVELELPGGAILRINW